jgi:hypothetical protein
VLDFPDLRLRCRKRDLPLLLLQESDFITGFVLVFGRDQVRRRVHHKIVDAKAVADTGTGVRQPEIVGTRFGQRKRRGKYSLAQRFRDFDFAGFTAGTGKFEK